MKNITITMEDDVAEWVRIEAAKRNASVSRLVGEWVGESMRQQDAYEQAMRAALKFETWAMPGPLSAATDAPPMTSRDDQYDRPSA